MDRSNSKANIKDKELSFDDDQLNSIKRNLDKDDLIMITGSLYLAGELLNLN